jgi:hypothetical protein
MMRSRDKATLDAGGKPKSKSLAREAELSRIPGAARSREETEVIHSRRIIAPT